MFLDLPALLTLTKLALDFFRDVLCLELSPVIPHERSSPACPVHLLEEDTFPGVMTHAETHSTGP